MTTNDKEELLRRARAWSDKLKWSFKYDTKLTASENWMKKFERFIREEYGS